MEVFDYVIVGAGTAGCVLAYRLAEGGSSVCVLEAGPPDTNPYIGIPGGTLKTSTDPRITWRFEHEATPRVNGRAIPLIQGRVLGGSSAINGMIHSRGQAADYDGWARAGCDGWDYASVLPYFRKVERFLDDGDEGFHGCDGPVPVGALKRRDPTCDSFIRGALEVGIPANPDYNGRNQTGVGYTQATIHKGRRWGSARAYLHPARRRFGVRVLTDALVHRILLRDGRAVGVEVARGREGAPRAVHAQRAVVVCAGSVNSPKLLQLSGIGPAAELQALGIAVQADVPGVGRNLSDHYAARIVARARSGVDTINGRARGLPLLGEIGAWLLGRPSILALSSVSVYAFCKVDEASAENDYAVTFTPGSLKAGVTRRLDDFPGVTSGTWALRPESRGHVRLRSADPHEPPVIQPNYLDAERDRLMLIAGLRRCSAILRSRAMSHIVERQVFPAQECRTDDEWLDFVRGHGMTAYHLVGTCRMGAMSDPLAVVDPQALRVRSVHALHVVDASVMPATPSANTNAAVLMLAEKGAEAILAQRPVS